MSSKVKNNVKNIKRLNLNFILVNQPLLPRREALKAFSTDHIERSERLNFFSQPTTSGKTRDFKDLCKPTTSSRAIEASGLMYLSQASVKVAGWP